MAEARSPDAWADDAQITDDDALAEAILATFTQSIPVVRPSRSLPSEADLIAIATGPIQIAATSRAREFAAAVEPLAADTADPTIPWAGTGQTAARSGDVEIASTTGDFAGAGVADAMLAPEPAAGPGVRADETPAAVRTPAVSSFGFRGVSLPGPVVVTDQTLTDAAPVPARSSGPLAADGRPSVAWPAAFSEQQLNPAADPNHVGQHHAAMASPEPSTETPPRGAHRASGAVDWEQAPAPAFTAPSLIEPPEHVAVTPPTTASNEIPPQARPVPVSASVGFAQLETTPHHDRQVTEPPAVLADAPTDDSGFAPAPNGRRLSRLARNRLVGLERIGLEPTPQDGRDGRSLRLFWLWFAANAGVLSLGMGGVLVHEGLSLRQSVVAALGGVVLSFLPLAIGALAGKWSGQPALVVSRASFGHFGNVLPALVALLSRVIWAGLLVWIAADGVRTGFASVGIRGSVVLPVSYAVCVILAAAIAIVGYGLITRIQGLLSGLSVLIVVALVVATAGRVDFSEALRRPDGSWVLVVGGVVSVFSFVGLAWVHSSADVARYQRRSGSNGAVATWAGLGAAIPALALVIWGAILAAGSPTLASELVVSPVAAIALVSPGTFLAPLLVLVAVTSLAGTVMSVYSAGFSVLAAGVKWSRPAATALAGGLAAVAAAVFCFDGGTDWMLARDLLIAAAVPIAAWTGVFLADLGARRGAYDGTSLLRRGGAYPDLRIVGLLGFIVASVLGFGFVTAGSGPLDWEGFGWRLLGLQAGSSLWSTQLGVLVALLVGLLFSIASSLFPGRRRGGDGGATGRSGTLRLAEAIGS